MKLFPKRLTGFFFFLIFIFYQNMKPLSEVASFYHSDSDLDHDSSNVRRFLFRLMKFSLISCSDILRNHKKLAHLKMSQLFRAFSEYLKFSKTFTEFFSFLFQPSSPHTSTIVDLCALRRSQTTLIFVNLSEIFSTAKDFHTIMYLIGTLLRRYVTKLHSF